jgi:hypothetical protein
MSTWHSQQTAFAGSPEWLKTSKMPYFLYGSQSSASEVTGSNPVGATIKPLLCKGFFVARAPLWHGCGTAFAAL